MNRPLVGTNDPERAGAGRKGGGMQGGPTNRGGIREGKSRLSLGKVQAAADSV